MWAWDGGGHYRPCASASASKVGEQPTKELAARSGHLATASARRLSGVLAGFPAAPGTRPAVDHWSFKSEAQMANDMHTDGRDVRSATYDAITPVNKQSADQAAHPSAAGHVDIPEGLLRDRRAPLNPRTGRRPTE